MNFQFGNRVNGGVISGNRRSIFCIRSDHPAVHGSAIHFCTGLLPVSRAGAGCAAVAGLPFSHNPGGTWAAGMKMGLPVGQAEISSGL